jgi:hypothetical protein
VRNLYLECVWIDPTELQVERRDGRTPASDICLVFVHWQKFRLESGLADLAYQAPENCENGYGIQYTRVLGGKQTLVQPELGSK